MLPLIISDKNLTFAKGCFETFRKSPYQPWRKLFLIGTYLLTVNFWSRYLFFIVMHHEFPLWRYIHQVATSPSTFFYLDDWWFSIKSRTKLKTKINITERKLHYNQKILMLSFLNINFWKKTFKVIAYMNK